jgi:hypothetical protein
MVESFVRFWPRSVHLEVYAEGFVPDQDAGFGWQDLAAAAPWLAPWIAAHDQPRHRGVMAGGRYNHRLDAIKFAHKVAALGAAARELDCEVLIWLDCDTLTHAPVTLEWLDRLLPATADIAWLDRPESYPECGFVMYRRPLGTLMIEQLVDLYASGDLFELPETHDSYALKHVVERAVGEVRVHSLTNMGVKYPGVHPWLQSELSTRMDHAKGLKRKAAGRSHPSERQIKDGNPYWR